MTKPAAVVAAAGLVVLLVGGCGAAGSRGVARVGAGSTASEVPLATSPSVSIGNAVDPTIIAIPQAPSGTLGSATDPLGSPAVAMASCGGASSAPAGLSVRVSGRGFSVGCYQVPAGVSVAGVLYNEATNSATGLPIAVEVTVSTLGSPVVAQEARSAPPAGVSVPAEAIPAVNLRNAVFTSPTAPDANPVSFTLPALPAGRYLLQAPTLPLIASAVLDVAGTATTATSVQLPTSTTIGNPSAVTVGALTGSDVEAVTAAFNTWEILPPSCPGQMVAGTSKEATVTASGVRWAIARFAPAATCSYALPPGKPGGPARSVPTNEIGPFGEPGGQPLGVFEQAPGGKWVMNEEGGSPFPCPAPNGSDPGVGNGALPADVLAGWAMSYAQGCAFVAYPTQPRQ